MTSLRIVLIALVAAALVPTAARADDYYATDDGHGACSQPSPCSVTAAVALANTTPATVDVIHVVGSISVSADLDLTQSPIALTGDGRGESHLSARSITAGDGSSVGHLTIAVSTGGTTTNFAAGVTLRGRATLDDADVTGTGPWAVRAETSRAAAPAITNSRIVSDSNARDQNSAVKVVGDAGNPAVKISDSSISGFTGVSVYYSDAAVVVQRCTIDAALGIQLVGSGWSYVENSLIRASYFGVQAASATVWVLGSTVVGGHGPTQGVFLAGTVKVPSLVENSIVRGFATDIDNAAQDGALVTRASDYVTAYGNLTDGGGNTTADPQWTDPAHGNYTLRAGSPLIDAGIATDLDRLGDRDLAGGARVVDGDGDGGAAIDVGAYEYGPSASPIILTTTPPTGDDPQPPTGDDPQPPAGNDPQPPAGSDPVPPAGDSPAPPAGQPPDQAGSPGAPSSPVTPHTARTEKAFAATTAVRGLLLTTRCSARCTVTATLRTGRHTLARAKGGAGRLRLRLSGGARRYVKRHHRRSVRLVVVARDGAGHKVTRTLTVRLP